MCTIPTLPDHLKIASTSAVHVLLRNNRHMHVPVASWSILVHMIMATKAVAV